VWHELKDSKTPATVAGTVHEGLICWVERRDPSLASSPQEFSMRLTTRIGAVLAGLVLAVGSGVAARSERQQMQDAFSLLDQAIAEFKQQFKTK
jgi:hypothetical protein